MDGRLSRPEVVGPLSTLDCLVTYVDWAKNEIEAAFGQLRRRGELRIPAIEVIPHGIDTGRFFPIVDSCGGGVTRRRAIARQRLFGEDNSLEDAFIVLNANRNQPRKRLDITIEAFAAFARDKPANVKLYLHTAAIGACRDLRAEALRWGVGDRVLLTKEDDSQHPSVPDETLNLIYNACDVGVNTSSGEGWGLVSFEHGATLAAQVVPGHSACASLWAGSGVVVDASLVNKLSRMPLRMSEVSAGDVADAFERLYTDRALLSHMSEAAQVNATTADLSWPAVGAKWNRLFQQLL